MFKFLSKLFGEKKVGESIGIIPIRTFLKLLDVVPKSYTGQANKVVKVNATETGLEFGTGGTGGGHTIQDEGTPLPARANLNFVGAAVTATDDARNDATKVTVEAEYYKQITIDPATTGLGGQLLGTDLAAGSVFAKMNNDGVVNGPGDLPDPVLHAGEYWILGSTSTSWYSDGATWTNLGFIATLSDWYMGFTAGTIYRVNSDETQGSVPVYYVRNYTNNGWMFNTPLYYDFVHQLPYTLGSQNETEVQIIAGSIAVVNFDNTAIPSYAVSVIGNGGSEFIVYSTPGDFRNQSWGVSSIKYPSNEFKYGTRFDRSATFTVSPGGVISNPPAMVINNGSGGWGNEISPTIDRASFRRFTLSEEDYNNRIINSYAPTEGQAVMWDGSKWTNGQVPYQIYSDSTRIIGSQDGGKLFINGDGLQPMDVGALSNNVPTYIGNASGGTLTIVAINSGQGFNDVVPNTLTVPAGGWVMGYQNQASGIYGNGPVFNVVASSHLNLIYANQVLILPPEDLSSQCNGANQVFNTTSLFSTVIYLTLDNVMLHQGIDFTITGLTQITLTSLIPDAGSKLIAKLA